MGGEVKEGERRGHGKGVHIPQSENKSRAVAGKPREAV